MATTDNMTESQGLRDIVVSRTIDAPRELVWQALTDAEHLKRWFAPGDFTTPACSVDLRPGGMFHYCMRSPEGVDYWGRGIYREIQPPERLVYTDSFSNEKGEVVSAATLGMSPDYPLETTVTITLEEAGNGKTRLTLHHAGVPADELGEMTEMGWRSQLDRLAEALERR